MRFSDLVTGLVFAGLGMAIVIIARGFPSLGGVVSPSLFPSIVGTVMAVSGLAIAAKAVLAGEALPVVVSAAWLNDPRKVAAVAIVPVAIAAFALLAPIAGSIIVGMAVLTASALIWRERVLVSILVGSVVSFGIYAFFYFGMRVSLPGGVVERLLQ